MQVIESAAECGDGVFIGGERPHRHNLTLHRPMSSATFRLRQSFSGITAMAVAGTSVLALSSASKASALLYDCFSRETSELVAKSAVDITSPQVSCLESAAAMVQTTEYEYPNQKVVYVEKEVPAASSGSTGEAILGGILGGVIGGLIEGSISGSFNNHGRNDHRGDRDRREDRDRGNETAEVDSGVKSGSRRPGNVKRPGRVTIPSLVDKGAKGGKKGKKTPGKLGGKKRGKLVDTSGLRRPRINPSIIQVNNRKMGTMDIKRGARRRSITPKTMNAVRTLKLNGLRGKF